jgi:hypothetical protein
MISIMVNGSLHVNVISIIIHYIHNIHRVDGYTYTYTAVCLCQVYDPDPVCYYGNNNTGHVVSCKREFTDESWL